MLVLDLERRPNHPGRGVVDQRLERAEGGNLVEHASGGHVAAHEHGLGARRFDLGRGRLGRPVVPQVPDRDTACAVTREAKRDRAPDPARAAGDEDGQARGRGSSAGADDGISAQPGPVRVR